MVRVCFVCLGNICRSPTADGIMNHLVGQRGLTREIAVDSAGTGPWHVGEAADRRARAVARRRGYRLDSRGRQFARADFDRFDYILAMDRSNLRDILSMAQTQPERARVRLFRAFDPDTKDDGERDVPDPYYGGARGFDDVFDMCERTCEALLDHICAEHGLRRADT